MKNNVKGIYNKSKRGILQVVFGRTMIIIVLLALQFFILFGLMFSFEKYIPYFFGNVTIFSAIMLLFVLNTETDPTIKLSWCVFIGVIPVFGALMYLFTRLDLGHRIVQKFIGKSIEQSKDYAKFDDALYEKIKNEDKGFYNLCAYLKNKGCFPVFENSDCTYFPFGEDKYKQMLIQLENAQKFIFLEYFIIKEGVFWQNVLDILIKKAEQGVDVRVLYDGTNAVANLPYGYSKKLEKANIKCKMYAPLRPFVSTSYNNRDHRKILVIDGKVAFTGGVNLADEYINLTHPYGVWKDTAIMVKGQAVAGFTRMFLEMWNYNEKQKDYIPYLETFETSSCGYVIPYGDNPMDKDNLQENVYLDIINRAKDYVYIMTPYLILDRTMENALCFAAQRGVDVRLILPKKPDHIYAYVLAEDHYPRLTNAGVKIYLYSPGFIHAKVFLSDEIIASVGSANLDWRSLYLHFECGCLMYKTNCIKHIKGDFDKTFKESYLINPDDIKKRNFLSRIAGFLLKAAAPLM